jgi:hypothetical protein
MIMRPVTVVLGMSFNSLRQHPCLVEVGIRQCVVYLVQQEQEETSRKLVLGLD